MNSVTDVKKGEHINLCSPFLVGAFKRGNRLCNSTGEGKKLRQKKNTVI